MPLFKGVSSKAFPNKAIAYITRKDKAKFVDSLGLDDSRSYAEQFKETSNIFHKNSKQGERKYYHFKLSADPKDNISPESHHEFAKKLAERLFPDNECVIATHIDTDTVHSHIITNSIDFINGRKLRISPNDYKVMKDIANEIGLSYGCSPLDYTQPSKVNITQAEKHIELKGGISWKQELREVLDLAMMISSSMDDFESEINKYGVTITKNTGKTISFKHPMKNKSIRGNRLGEKYSRKEIQNELSQSRIKSQSFRLSKDGSRDKETGLSERSVKRSTGRRSENTESTSAYIQRKTDAVHESVYSVSGEDDFELDNTSEESTLNREPTGPVHTGFGGISM